MSPRIKTASRVQILRAVRTLLSDGKPRTARALVEELARTGLLTDKAIVNSVLCIDGRHDFVRDNTNFTYALLSTGAAQSNLRNSAVVRPRVAAAAKGDANSTQPSLQKTAIHSGARALALSVANVPAPRPTSKVGNVPVTVSEAFSRAGSLFSAALSDEIAAVRKSGGQKTYLSDGKYVGTNDGQYVYSFSADSELRFPDDTPVDLEYRGTKHPGVIRSVSGFDVVLSIGEHIGDSVATAVLYTAPWFLLEELKKRLSEAQNSDSANLALACRLLSRSQGIELSHNAENAENLLARVEARMGARLELNTHQVAGVAAAISRPITFVWGPPGTGKTTTLGATIAALAEAGETALVVAHSNAAVDVAMQAVARCMQGSQEYRSGRVLRYGGAASTDLHAYPDILVRNVIRREYPQLVSELEHLEERKAQIVRRSRQDKADTGIQHELKEINKEIEPLRQRLKELEGIWVRAASVVGCTLSKATISPAIYESQFDAVVVDEACMAYIPHCAFAATLATMRISVFGDFRQLAPISQADTPRSKEWLQRDIFEATGITDQVNKGLADPRLVMLQTQYRMHPAIASVPNNLFYGGRLNNAPGLEERTEGIVNSTPAPGQALGVCDITALSAHCYSDRQSYSRFNPVSAIITVKMAYETACASSRQVGIITPYSAQSRLIYRIVRDLDQLEKSAASTATKLVPLHERVKVATVHKYQGSEQDIILFDVVEGLPKAKPGQLVLGDMDSGAMRLANVAISRARGKFVSIANYRYIRSHVLKDDAFRQMLDAVASHAQVQELSWSDTDSSTVPAQLIPGVRFYPTSIAAKLDINSDLKSALAEVAIYWPRNIAPYHYSLSALRDAGSTVRYFATVPPGDRSLVGLQNARILEKASDLSIGLVGVDQKRIWLYLDPKDPAAPVLKISLPGVAKLLYAYWRLIPDEELQRDLVEDRVAQGKSPIGRPCPRCRGALWLNSGRYGSYMVCTGAGCGYTKAITPSDATDLAQLMGIKCSKCGGQVRGRKAYDGVFLGCVNYPTCRWTKSLDSTV